MRTRWRHAAFAALLGAACSSTQSGVQRDAGTADGPPQSSAASPFFDEAGRFREDLGAPCDKSRTVKSDGAALLVRDPDTLSRFPLEKVLRQIATTAGSSTSPTELLQRLFDTENTTAGAVFADSVHCDFAAFKDNPIADCPRAEGRLAKSTGLLTLDDPDSFVPVGLVSRFDLMPDDLSGCGEYRIVYAKRSGRTDRSDRVFLIFESALRSPQLSLASCRPVAEFLAGLDDPSQPTSLADRLEKFYFEGLTGFAPVVRAQQYGLNQSDCVYGKCGQIRLGQGMQTPWEFRQFRLATADGQKDPLLFLPTADASSPRPDLFDPDVTDQTGSGFRSLFASNVVELTGSDVATMGMTSSSGYDSMGSALDGPGKPDYLARTMRGSGETFRNQIALSLERLKIDTCPISDPLTPESILQRATAVTCAGCHAPERLLSPERKIGCGQVWPNSLGEAHIDEQGNLSEALTQVFLPHRANVLATFLQACDEDAIRNNLLPVPARVIAECFVAGTPVTMMDGSEKAIEKIVPGEIVLTYDEPSGAPVPGHVERTFVRPQADRLIVVNGSLIATSNHAFRTVRGWVAAEELEVGDALIGLDSARGSDALDVEPARVRELTMRPGSVITYNLEIAIHHAYFAGGLLVHDGP